MYNDYYFINRTKIQIVKINKIKHVIELLAKMFDLFVELVFCSGCYVIWNMYNVQV